MTDKKQNIIEVAPSCLGGTSHVVGSGGVLEIRATQENGEYAYVPYVEVWGELGLIAKYCMHKLDGVWHEPRSNANEK